MTTLTDRELGQVDHMWNSLAPAHPETQVRLFEALERFAVELNDVAALSQCAAAARRIAWARP